MALFRHVWPLELLIFFIAALVASHIRLKREKISNTDIIRIK
jgi:hypothetical protein